VLPRFGHRCSVGRGRSGPQKGGHHWPAWCGSGLRFRAQSSRRPPADLPTLHRAL